MMVLNHPLFLFVLSQGSLGSPPPLTSFASTSSVSASPASYKISGKLLNLLVCSTEINKGVAKSSGGYCLAELQ